MISGVLHREYPHIDLHDYPAHLHINLDVAARGRGLGQDLMEAYIDQLRHFGIPGVHLNTTSVNVAACRLYEKIGFRLLEERPTKVWSNLLDRPVENRSYGLNLRGDL
jgi:RimJ/RimL family protein N-acetyltransferase